MSVEYEIKCNTYVFKSRDDFPDLAECRPTSLFEDLRTMHGFGYRFMR